MVGNRRLCACGRGRHLPFPSAGSVVFCSSCSCRREATRSKDSRVASSRRASFSPAKFDSKTTCSRLVVPGCDLLPHQIQLPLQREELPLRFIQLLQLQLHEHVSVPNPVSSPGGYPPGLRDGGLHLLDPFSVSNSLHAASPTSRGSLTPRLRHLLLALDERNRSSSPGHERVSFREPNALSPSSSRPRPSTNSAACRFAPI